MDLRLPNLGEGADSGTVVNLFVKEGDQVTRDQPILELENEKAVATIPSTAAGRVTQIFVKAGDKLTVGQRILSLSETGDSTGEKAAEVKPERGKTPAARAKIEEQRAKQKEEEPQEAIAEEEHSERAEAEAVSKEAHEIAASPSIRKLARELGIDLTRVRGSERGGRIVLTDIRAYIQKLQRLAAQDVKAAARPITTTTQAETPKPEPIDFSRWGPVSKKPFSPLRQTIARRLTETWHTIPHVTQFDDADITTLMALRLKHAKAYEQKGARLTLTGFALKAVLDVLKKHPVFNSSLDDAAHELVSKEYYHIGVAVDTEAGLIVPVLRDVDKKTMFDLSKEIEELAKKARERKVTAEELKGGNFTNSEQGGVGNGPFFPRIQQHRVGRFGVGWGG